MRLSLLRMWITVGFAVVAIQVALVVFVLVRTRQEAGEMRKAVAEMREDIDRLKREVATLNRDSSRGRRTTEDAVEAIKPADNATPKGPDFADLIRHHLDAHLDGRPAEKEAAAQRLREGGAEAVKAVVTALGSEPSGALRGALYALLGSSRSREGLAHLQQAILDERDAGARAEAAAALSRSGDPSSMGILAAALAHERDSVVRSGIMKAIAAMDSDEAGQLLLGTYETAEKSEKVQILAILSGMSRPSLKPLYQRILADSKSVSDRVLAVRGLGNLKDPGLMTYLESLKGSDPEESVRDEAEKAIAKVRGN